MNCKKAPRPAGPLPQTEMRGVEPLRDISPGGLANRCPTFRRHLHKAGVTGIEPVLLVLETSWLP